MGLIKPPIGAEFIFLFLQLARTSYSSLPIFGVKLGTPVSPQLASFEIPARWVIMIAVQLSWASKE